MSEHASRWTLEQMPSQAGRRFLITGANSGIGFSAAVELARHGAVVLLGCRDRGKGEQSLARLRAEAKGPGSAADKAQLVLLDLASLASVRAVAEAQNSLQAPLHGLINNAGVMGMPRRQKTRDGFELQFGTNVLGHYALTCLLMPSLQLGGAARGEDAARVVTVASIAHKRGSVQFDNLNSERSYSPMGAYQQSKLADLMFTFELERRLRQAGIGVVSIGVHPGVAQTNIFKIGSSQGLARVAERAVGWGLGTFLNTELGGAIPTLFAATAREAQGGAYYGSQGLLEARGNDVGSAKIAKKALDEEAQRRLWEACEKMTGASLHA